MKTRYFVARSAKSGRYVPLWMARRYPNSHIFERRKK